MIISFEELKKDFTSRSKTLTNKRLFVQDELKQVDVFINHKLYDVQPQSMFGSFQNSYYPSLKLLGEIFNIVKYYAWDIFIDSYTHYYYNEEEKEFTPATAGRNTTQSQLEETNKKLKECHNQGSEFAKYVLWLKRSESRNELPKAKKSEITIKQKLLALYYLGLDLSKLDNVKSAKILSQILDVGEENTRKYLSYLANGKNEVRTKQNLEKVSQLFENAGITNISNNIKSEIEKIK